MRKTAVVVMVNAYERLTSLSSRQRPIPKERYRTVRYYAQQAKDGTAVACTTSIPTSRPTVCGSPVSTGADDRETFKRCLRDTPQRAAGTSLGVGRRLCRAPE